MHLTTKDLDRFHSLLTTLLYSLGMTLTYFVSGVIATDIFTQHKLITVVAFAPEGFALAGVLIYGKKVLPGIFLGQMMLAVYHWSDLASAAGIGLVNTLEAYIAYTILSRVPFNPKLTRSIDVVWLIGLILFVLQPFSALLGNLCLYISGEIIRQELVHSLFYWWLGNVMGQILFTPFLLLIYYRLETFRWEKLLAVMFGFGLYNYVLQAAFHISNPSLLLLLTLPFTLFMAIRHIVYGLGGALSLALGSLVLIHYESGTFIQSDVAENIVNLNIFLLTHILLVLIIGTIFDEKHRLVEQLQSIAHYDYLTGLPNRYLLRNEIHRAVSLCRTHHTKSAICYIDLDDFKPVNDAYGHHFGDMLLQETTHRITRHLSTDDSFLRLGGDEFLVIFNRLDSIDEALQRLDAIMSDTTKPLIIEGKTMQISLSIGVAVCPDDGENVKELMEKADHAMYKAKTEGKNTIRIHHNKH